MAVSKVGSQITVQAAAANVVPTLDYVIATNDGGFFVYWYGQNGPDLTADTDSVGRFYGIDGANPGSAINFTANVSQPAFGAYALLDDGHLAAVYLEKTPPRANWLAFDQILNKDGTPLTTATNYNTLLANTVIIAPNAGDGFKIVVTYVDFDLATKTAEQDYLSNGVASGAPILPAGIVGPIIDVTQSVGGDQYYALDGAGHAALRNIDGTSAGPIFSILSTETAVLEDGRLVVVWTSAGDLFGRVFNPDGTASSSIFTVASGVGNQDIASVVSTAPNEIVVSWLDYNHQINGVTAPSVEAQVFHIDPVAPVTGQTFTTSSGTNTTHGTQGADTMNLSGAVDTAYGRDGDDVINTNSGFDIIHAGPGNDTITAANLGDQLYGDQGNDTFSIGADITAVGPTTASGAREGIYGGANTGVGDTLDVSASSSALWLDVTYPIAQMWTKDTHDLVTGTWRAVADVVNIENFVTTAYDDYIRTDGSDNTITYIGGHDTIDTGAGTDTIDFSQFGHAIWLDTAYAGDAAWTKNGADLVSGSWAALASITNVEKIIGTLYADQLYVNAGTTSVVAGNGADTIFVRAVTPGIVANLNAGGGNDTLDFSPFGSAAWVNLSDASPVAWTTDAATQTGGAWRAIGALNSVENLAGSSFDDFLRGDGNTNVIYYSGGYDQLDGSGGVDTLDLSRFGSAMWADLALTTQSLWTKDGPTLSTGAWRAIGDVSNFENVTGTAFADYLAGTSGDNTIDGGAGNDTASYYNAIASVTVDLAAVGAQVTGGAGVDTLISIENLTGSSSGDALSGDAGANILDGGAGADTLTGRAGNDIYVVDNVLDTVVENPSEGTDLVRTSLTSYTLGANVENYQFIGAGSYTANGNALDNSFIVNAVSSGALAALNGAGEGAAGDTADFSGFGGALWIVLDYSGIEAWTTDAADQSHGTFRTIADLNGIENLVGSAFSDDLRGDANANTIFYTGGYDHIDGKGGTDTLDASRFGSAIWLDLNLTSQSLWTQDAPNLTSGVWRAIGDISHIENVTGTTGADYLKGDANSNRLANGGGGDDFMTGGAGSDTFVFSANALGALSGFATISDFVHGQEHIELSSAYAGLLHITTGANSVADFGDTAHFHITTTGVANLDASDFIFV